MLDEVNAIETQEILTYEHDLPDAFLKAVRHQLVVGWDIETTGLDWKNDKICICQLHTLGKPAAIVRITQSKPANLVTLLADPTVKKVFHHAMFDLRFMAHNWQMFPRNIACTKIASKILAFQIKNNHNLQALLRQHLGVTISKKERLSNWLSNNLRPEQLKYAAQDVVHLLQLLDVLEKRLTAEGRIDLAHKSFEYIPTRVQLDLLGCGDVFSY